jgi:hypothetical protein
MICDDDLFSESQRAAIQRLREISKTRVTNELIVPKIKMVASPWYVDEYGNQTREIKALD